MDDEYRPRSPSPDISAPVVDGIEPHIQHRSYRGSVSHISPFGTTPTESKPAFSFSSPGQHLPPQLNNYSFNNNNNNNNNNHAFYNPFSNNQSPLQEQDHIMKHEEEYVEDEEYQPESKQRPASRAKKIKTEASDMGNGAINNAPGVAEGIEVRTKFPVARIKRIMQADEDVGKVAQVTPVAVCKFFSPLFSKFFWIVY
jgi:Dr1-associated corepressor